jgi:hypothetical protein
MRQVSQRPRQNLALFGVVIHVQIVLGARDYDLDAAEAVTRKLPTQKIRVFGFSKLVELFPVSLFQLLR